MSNTENKPNIPKMKIDYKLQSLYEWTNDQ